MSVFSAVATTSIALHLDASITASNTTAMSMQSIYRVLYCKYSAASDIAWPGVGTSVVVNHQLGRILAAGMALAGLDTAGSAHDTPYTQHAQVR